MGKSELLCVALLAGTGAAYYHDVQPIYVSVAMSLVAGLLTYLLIPAAAQLFINARLYGIDLSKSTSDVKVYATARRSAPVTLPRSLCRALTVSRVRVVVRRVW
jgi:hypothetical protein